MTSSFTDSTSHQGPTKGQRGVFAALLIASGALFVGCGGSEEEEARGPNVILITLDTVRADYLTCYGSSTGATPALDGLATGGTLFERAVSASGLTPASHATILTGQFQYRHGVRVLAADSGYFLEPGYPSLATQFKAAGYRTAAVHSAFPVSAHFGFDGGFDHFDSFEAPLQDNAAKGTVGWDVTEYQRRSDETTARTLAWIDEAEEVDEPFFLWIHYWDPHDPVKLPPEADLNALRASPEIRDIMDQSTSVYAAEIRWQDKNIGALLASLSGRGLMDETVIAVTADHGQGLVDGVELHGWGAHRMLYREQVHVPLIVQGPGIPAAKRIVDQVRTADVAPTLLEAAGLKPFENALDGESLMPRILGEASGDLTAYGEQINGYDFNAGMRRRRPDSAFLYMVSDGAWKLIYKPHMPEASELFHVAVDPMEKKNVIAEHPDEKLRLMADLAERNPWVLGAFPKVERATGDASAGLEGLGYSGTLDGSGTWWWTCPEHTDFRADERDRHKEGGCGRILVPMGIWSEPDVGGEADGGR